MTLILGCKRLSPILVCSALLTVLSSFSSSLGQQIPLQSIVSPSTIISKDGRHVTFALHGYIEFTSLAEAFPYIDAQSRRWQGNISLDSAARRRLASTLVREAVESRIISMGDERPLETLVTHTDGELRAALSLVKEPTPPGYAEAFLAVQEKWKHSLNCWSASPSIAARVLSNWYPIEEGIQLYGATYDSTEHFWQAVKFHPDVTVSQLSDLLAQFDKQDWAPWIARLDADPKLYLPNAYAVEFLRFNLKTERFHWFLDQLARHNLDPKENPRAAQQRGASPLRFTALEEKVLWGDLADLFHLVYHFSAAEDPIRKLLAEEHFDAVYLKNRKMGFISQDFRSLMLEIWRVKYLEMPRFREVISSIPGETRLSHFLNDGDSPDIPIPVYVGYLNQIRDLARRTGNPK
jgi:hypothetical protein